MTSTELAYHHQYGQAMNNRRAYEKGIGYNYIPIISSSSGSTGGDISKRSKGGLRDGPARCTVYKEYKSRYDELR